MKLRVLGIGVIALVILGVALFPPTGSPKETSLAYEDAASIAAASGQSRTSNQRRMGGQDKLSQQELAQQFIIEADKIIAEKQITFGVLVMYSLSGQMGTLPEQMDRETVLQLLKHYEHWDTDVYVCGVCCHLLQRLAQIAPEEALALYDKKIGLSKVTAMLKLSDDEEEEELEKNPKAIPTLSLMALASGYKVGKPGSRTLFQAFKKTIPWEQITRAMAEDEEALVGENGMLCLMLFIGMLAEECKVQPEFALAELRALPTSDTMKMSFLSNLVDDDEIPYGVLQNVVESHLISADPVSEEREQLAVSFAKRIFETSPHEAEQWLAAHKLPLKDRSVHELESYLISWKPENHFAYMAWFDQLDSDLRPRIAAQKIEQLGFGIAIYGVAKSEKQQEYHMLDALAPHLSSAELLNVIQNVAKRNHAEDDTAFRELLRHLHISEVEVQTLLEEKNKSE